MSQKQVIDIDQLRHATDEIRDEKYAAVRILGHATLNLYEKLEKIPTHSVIKKDSVELQHRIDKLVALFRDSPWKDMKGNEWKDILLSEINTLEPFIKAFPKQIQKTNVNDAYVLKALKSYCDEVMVARKEVENLSWFIKKVVNVYLGPIFNPFDQIAQTLQAKAREFDIDLTWEEPPAPQVIPVIEEPVIEEKFEVTIEHIKLETDILKKLKAIENTLRTEFESFQTIQTELEEQVNNKSLLQKLIRANSIVSLREVGASIQVNEEPASAIENKTELNPIFEVIRTYQPVQEESESSSEEEIEYLHQLSFDKLAELYERIQNTASIITHKIQTLPKPIIRELEKPVEPKALEDDTESTEPVAPKQTGWLETFGADSSYTAIALKQKNDQLRQQKHEAEVETYQTKLRLYELELKEMAQQQEIYTEKLQILEKDLSLLHLATNIIAGILETAADQKIIGLERLMLRLKELKTVPIVEQLEEQKLLPPKELTRSEKINLFYKKFIMAVVNPLIIIWQIIMHLNSKFNPPTSKSADFDDPAFYAKEEGASSEESTHNKVVGKLKASKRKKAQDNKKEDSEDNSENASSNGSDSQPSRTSNPIQTSEEEESESLLQP